MPSWSPRSSPHVAVAATWAAWAAVASLARATKATREIWSPTPRALVAAPAASCTFSSEPSMGAKGSVHGTSDSAASDCARTTPSAASSMRVVSAAAATEPSSRARRARAASAGTKVVSARVR